MVRFRQCWVSQYWKSPIQAMKQLIKLICIIVVCVATRAVLADPPPDDLAAAKRRIADLEGEVKSLQARIRQLEAAEQKGAGPEANVTPDANADKTFHSALDILRIIPKELQPRPGVGWDKYSIGKAQDWLTKQPIGEGFDANLKIASVAVARNPAWYNNHSQPEWQAQISLETHDCKFISVALTEAVGGNWPQPLRVVGDEAFARSAERIKKGSPVHVSGKISGIYLGPEDRGRREFHIGLSDYKVESPSLKR